MTVHDIPRTTRKRSWVPNIERSAFGVRRWTLRVERSSPPPPFSSLRQPSCRKGAFTLIETALAMLAIGLGLLALFGLGRIGLQTSKETDNDQRCALMADAIFETLREHNARFIDNAQTNVLSASWHKQWETAYGSPRQIPFPPVANMSTSEDLFLVFAAENPFAPAYDENELSLADWNPRYGLHLFFDNNYHSPVAGDYNLIRVTLVIYPDGDTYSSEYRIFKTTLSDTGGLQ